MRRLDKGVERTVALRESVAQAASISREPFPQSATAEQAARNWSEYRKQMPQPVTAQEAARNWAAYRERQQAEAALQQNTKQTVSHEGELEKAQKVASRSLEYDAGL
jgi:hypothetical protein